jgi:hypothetical protein
MKKTILKSTLAIYFLLMSVAYCYAQKLPEIQQNSLRAPSTIKIDGKATEWGDKFEAYNHATDIFYTMCNDDENLYLVVRTSDADVLSKITNRGVVLVINASGKKTDNGAVSITYPIFELQYGNKPYIAFSNVGGLLRTQRMAMDANPDSMLRVANKKLHDNEKFIRTSGMADVDTLLSVYNNKGIIAREGFGTGMVYTYELAVPLKTLKLSLASTLKFTYHVMLEGIGIEQDMGMKTTKNAEGVSVVSFAKGSVSFKRDHLPIVTSTTDFWGEYTLAKKP